MSICSNVGGHLQPICLVNEDIPTLVSNMIGRMEVISDVVGDTMQRKYSVAFDKLQELINGWDDDDESLGAKMMLKDLKSLKGSLHAYCEQVPVLGFNSSNYDLNLIKGYIANYLRMDDDEISGVTIKKNNCYSCISNRKLKFLDVSSFLAPGTSYSKKNEAYSAGRG